MHCSADACMIKRRSRFQHGVQRTLGNQVKSVSEKNVLMHFIPDILPCSRDRTARRIVQIQLATDCCVGCRTEEVLHQRLPSLSLSVA